MCRRQLILLLIIYMPNSLCIIEDVYNTAIAVDKLYSYLNETGPDTYYLIRDIHGTCKFNNAKNNFVNNQLDKIHERLVSMEASLKTTKISETFKSWPNSTVIVTCIDTIELHLPEIGKFYDEFHLHRLETEDCDNRILQEFMEKANFEVQTNIQLIRNIVIEKFGLLPNYSNLLDAITSNGVMLREHICNGPDIIAASFIRLFKRILIAEIKSHIVLAFARMYVYHQSRDWKTWNSETLRIFKERFEVYVNEFRKGINIADQLYLRTCDPVDGIWIRDKNYYELVGTFQRTIFRYHWGVCKYGSCNDIARIRNRCEVEHYNQRSSCHDEIGSCTYLGAIKACVLKSGPYKFQYVNSTKLGSLGRNFECPKINGDLIDDDTTNYVHAACACNCLSNRNRISLLIMKSHIASNRVIVGLRFIIKNRILYIQPREGKLEANGYLQQFSERWIPLPKNIPSSHVHSINKTNNIIFLDDLRLPAYHVLTGIKFNKVRRENKTGFAIEIFGVPFDYGSGRLYSGSKFMVSKQASNEILGEMLSYEAVNSIYSTLRHTPSPARFNYVAIKRSDTRDDFGQSTLPLFDAVLVRPNPTSLLRGVGVFHKGAEGFAGFISLRIFPIDYKKFFEDFQSVHMKDGKLSFESGDNANNSSIY